MSRTSRGENLTREEIERRVRSVETWYHSIELGQGVVTPGVFDMRPFVGHYRIPEDLSGVEALDVGASNGFFSFLLERRGARVLATDLPTFADHDSPDWVRAAKLSRFTREDLARIDHHELKGGFEVASEILDSRVERILGRIYDLPALLDRTFDLVLCSNVLPHLRDPLAALEALRRVLKPGGRLILAARTERTRPEESYAVFVGDPDAFAWWVPSREALLRMCRTSGFAELEVAGEFEMSRLVAPLGPEWVTVLHGRRAPGR